MTNKMKWTAAVIAALVAGAGAAGSIKVWSNGQTLTASDINGNFSHIHSLMVGGHGARLVDADVSPSAAISSSKLAQGAGMVDGWAKLSALCSAGTCTIQNSYNITSITFSSTGNYTVNLPSPIGTGTMCVAQVFLSSGFLQCDCDYASATTLTISCQDSSAVATNARFKFVYWSN